MASGLVGRVSWPFSHWQRVYAWIEELSYAPLKLYQHIELLRNHALPKLLHGLVLGNIHSNTLKAIDIIIRGGARLWLRLPKDCPVGFFHTAISEVGLSLPALAVSVPLTRQCRYEKLFAVATSGIVRDSGALLSEQCSISWTALRRYVGRW